MKYSFICENGTVKETLEIAGKKYVRESFRSGGTTEYLAEDFGDRLSEDGIDEDFCDEVWNIFDSNFTAHDVLGLAQKAAERGL